MFERSVRRFAPRAAGPFLLESSSSSVPTAVWFAPDWPRWQAKTVSPPSRHGAPVAEYGDSAFHLDCSARPFVGEDGGDGRS